MNRMSYAHGRDGDPLTYTATQISGPGSFSYNSSTGAYSYTPSQSDHGVAVIVFTARDGALTSNKATLIFPGWQLNTTDPDELDLDGDDFIAGQNLPYASNQYLSVDQNGSLQVYASAGLLTYATDTDPQPDTDSPTVNPTLIENPRHGSVYINSNDGSFLYTPNPGFSGRDYFTWQVVDGGKQGDYATAFIDVQPVTVTISVNNLKPGDPSAQVPNIQFPPDAQGDPQYATLNLGVPGGLPDGSTVTLSVNSDVQSDLDVYDGIPGQSGTNLLFGKDADTSNYTWTTGGSQYVPSTVYAVGLAGTDYDQPVFNLSVTVAQQAIGTPPANPPAQGPQTQPVASTQPTTVPGKHGRLEALDGTKDSPDSGTNIYLFARDHYTDTKNYIPGVGNKVTNPNKTTAALLVVFGDLEAYQFERQALTDVISFYNADKQNRDIPLDIVGYSRGALEGVKLANDVLARKVPDSFQAARTVGGKVTEPTMPIDVRWMYLISPVMGGAQLPTWATSLSADVGTMDQALDPDVLNAALNQIAITRDPKTKGGDQTFHAGHTQIQHSQEVLARMVASATTAKVPVK